MKYTCRVCGEECIIENETIVRTCEHEGEGVVAHCSATCTGEGTLE